MKPALLAIGGVAATLALAACGSGTSASTGAANASASPSGAANGARRGGATAGELVQISLPTLLLNTQSGDAKVSVGGTTTLSKTRTGTVADIVKGSCITAGGQKDASGALTASQVQVRPKVNGTCNPPRGVPSPNPSFSPRADRSPPAGAPQAFARGEVLTVTGTAVTVQDSSGTTTTSATLTVPTTVKVAVAQPITATDLAVGDCVAAMGQKDASGTVAARSITVVPPGPSGCFTGGAGGFGFGRGNGGGAPGGAPAGAPSPGGGA
jgi:hypothetical protein